MICFGTALLLLAAMTCPRVSWWGQTICGSIGALLILVILTDLTDIRHVEKLARITTRLIGRASSRDRSPIARKPRRPRDQRTAKVQAIAPDRRPMPRGSPRSRGILR
jgi:hypothetical protein